MESDYGFDTAIPTTDGSLNDGSGWNVASAGSLKRASDPSAPLSSPYVLEYTYPIGLSPGYSVGQLWRSPSSNSIGWYVSLAMWHDSAFDFNAASNKFLTFFTPGNGTDLLETSHAGAPLTWQFEHPGQETILYGATTAFGDSLTEDSLRGHWINLEVEYLFGAGTGSVRVWAGRSDGADGPEGQLVMSYSKITVLGPTVQISLDSTWGGSSEPIANKSIRRLDHILIAKP